MEYAWDMNWCDPCAADPLSNEQLKELGVFWLNEGRRDDIMPMPRPQMRRPMPMAKNVYVTRLHVRYDAESFPEDLKFKTTGDKKNFQGRYILRHAYDGEMECPEAEAYRQKVNERKNKEVKTLANLTNWETSYIRKKIETSDKGGFFKETPDKPKNDWWNNIWPDEK